MDRNWNNARHCAEALRSLLENLRNQYGGRSKGLPSNQSFFRPAGEIHPSPPTMTEAAPDGDSPSEGNEPSKKRKRPDREERLSNMNGNESRPSAGRPTLSQRTDSNIDPNLDADSYPLPSFDTVAIFPSLEYAGPDMGFSSGQFANTDDFGNIEFGAATDMYSNNPGAFGNIGWEAMANGSGNVQDWVSWNSTKS